MGKVQVKCFMVYVYYGLTYPGPHICVWSSLGASGKVCRAISSRLAYLSGGISVAMPVVYLTMLNLWLGCPGDWVSSHNLQLTRHAANECRGWVNIVIWFRLSYTPRGLASVDRVIMWKTATIPCTLYHLVKVYKCVGLVKPYIPVGSEEWRYLSSHKRCTVAYWGLPFLSSVASLTLH